MGKIAQDSTLKDILNQLKDVNHVIDENSTTIPLLVAGTWIGDWYDISAHNSLIVAAKSDQAGEMYVDFSTNKVDVDSTLNYILTAATNEVHRITVTRKWVRIRVLNTSGVNQTYLRVQSLAGSHAPLNSALNTQVQADQDTIVVRPLDFNLMVAESLYQNRQNTIKDGLNSDIDSASVPEDIWGSGGVYTGFPTGAVEAAELVVAGADTGTVYYSYLASAESTDYVFGNVAVAGAGTYPLGHNIWRCNFMYFVETSGSAFNVNTMTIRNTPTTANVFCTIEAGFSQSYCSGYTVPYGSSIYIDRITGSVKGSTSGYMDGFFWYRPYGESPRLRFPFVLQFGALYFDDIDYLIRVPERTDMIPRITVSSTNNLSAQVSYRLIKVKS